MADMPSLTMKRLRHVAKIMGPSSATAKALAEYEQRTSNGEDVMIFERGRTLIVGPANHPSTCSATRG